MPLFVTSGAMVERTPSGPSVTPLSHVGIASNADEARTIATAAAMKERPAGQAMSMSSSKVPDALVREAAEKSAPLFVSAGLLTHQNEKGPVVTPAHHVGVAPTASDAKAAAAAEMMVDSPGKRLASLSTSEVPAGMVREAMREMMSMADPNLNVEKYSRQVIDSYRQNRSEMDPTTARSVTIAAASTAVSEQGRASISDAAKVARTAIDSFEKQAKSGVPIDKARENVARSMADQFESRGRETQRHGRDRSNALGL